MEALLQPFAALSGSSLCGGMAVRAACGADIRQQLAKLLGKPVARIGQVRKTDETPPRISVIDVATLVTGKNASLAASWPSHQ